MQHRHHWGMASATDGSSPRRLTFNRRKAWRSPLGRINLWLSQTQVSQHDSMALIEVIRAAYFGQPNGTPL